jgi:GNAT superfamily N-acetyltransferase
MWADMTTRTVNTANQDDMDALIVSVAGLFAEDGARHDSLMDAGWPAREGASYYSALIGDKACLVTLARQDDEVIGHLIGRLSEPGGLRTGRIAVLESMRVAPAARGTGVGSLLVENFLAWARDHDAAQASVTAFAANGSAQRFYERHGFVPQSVTSRAIL